MEGGEGTGDGDGEALGSFFAVLCEVWYGIFLELFPIGSFSDRVLGQIVDLGTERKVKV